MQDFVNNQIHKSVIMGSNVKIGVGALVYPNVQIDDNVNIGPYCIIGEPMKAYYTEKEYKFKRTRIGRDSIIRSHCIIYEGNLLGEGLETGHHVVIREGSRIGRNCSFGTFTDIQGNVNIGNFVRCHSNVHIAQLTTVEDYVWIYPFVTITNDLFPPHGELAGCIIKKYAQIAVGAKLLPGITIGENAFVGVGSVVSKDVEPSTVVFGNPAKFKCRIEELRKQGEKQIYPWREYLKEARGYPWEDIKETEKED